MAGKGISGTGKTMDKVTGAGKHWLSPGIVAQERQRKGSPAWPPGLGSQLLLPLLSGKEPARQCRRHEELEFDPWVRKIPWRMAQQPTPVFLPGKSHEQRSLVGYSPWGCKESGTTEATSHTHKAREYGSRVGLGKVLMAAGQQVTVISLNGLMYPKNSVLYFIK